MRYSENFQGLFSCQTQDVDKFSKENFKKQFLEVVSKQLEEKKNN